MRRSSTVGSTWDSGADVRAGLTLSLVERYRPLPESVASGEIRHSFSLL